MAERKHSEACERAKQPVCKCSCGGSKHGIAVAQEDDDKWDYTLSYEEAEPFRAQFKRNKTCVCGQKGIWDLEIRAYWHPGGWFIQGRLAWLYIHCPNCGYDFNLSKLGVLREPSLDEFAEIIQEADE